MTWTSENWQTTTKAARRRMEENIIYRETVTNRYNTNIVQMHSVYCEKCQRKMWMHQHLSFKDWPWSWFLWWETDKNQHEREKLLWWFLSKIQYCSKFKTKWKLNVEKTNKIRTIAKFNDRYYYYFVFIISFGFTQRLFSLVHFGLIHHQNHSK